MVFASEVLDDRNYDVILISEETSGFTGLHFSRLENSSVFQIKIIHCKNLTDTSDRYIN